MHQSNLDISFVRTLIKPLIEKADIPMPNIRISGSKQINAWANYKNYTLIVTENALNTLSIKNLIGMFSHEIGHLYIYKHTPHNFLRKSTNIFLIMDSIFTIIAVYILGSLPSNILSNILSIIVACIWFLSVLYNDCNIEKENELEADKIGTKLCGNNDVLSLLEFLYTKCRPAHLYQYTRFYQLFIASHPSTLYRISCISNILTVS